MRDFDLLIWSAFRFINHFDELTEKEIKNFKGIFKKAKNFLRESQKEAIERENLENLYWREDERFLLSQKIIKEALTENTEEVLTEEDLDILYRYATFYSIGRMTYIVDSALEWTKEMKDKATKETKEKILSRIEDFRKRNALGMSCDIENWEEVKNLLKTTF